jgi:hypothetical protein
MDRIERHAQRNYPLTPTVRIYQSGLFNIIILRTLSGVIGDSQIRLPIASATALAMAATGGMIGVLPLPWRHKVRPRREPPAGGFRSWAGLLRRASDNPSRLYWISSQSAIPADCAAPPWIFPSTESGLIALPTS